MTRQLLPVSYTTDPQTIVASDVVGIVEFLELDLPSGIVYLTNAPCSYMWGGNTYDPVTSTGAPMGSMLNYNESLDGIPRPMTLTLSGADTTLVDNLVGNNIQWSKVYWSLGLIDTDNALINGTPFFTTLSYLGDCTISAGDSTVTISCENLLADMSRHSGMLQTIQDQQKRFSDDSFFTFTASLQFQWIYWNQAGPAKIGTAGTRGAGGDLGGGGNQRQHQYPSQQMQ